MGIKQDYKSVSDTIKKQSLGKSSEKTFTRKAVEYVAYTVAAGIALSAFCSYVNNSSQDYYDSQRTSAVSPGKLESDLS